MDSKSRNSNYSKLASILAPKEFSAQADNLAAGEAGGPGDKLHAKRSRDLLTRFNDRADWGLDEMIAPPIRASDRGGCFCLGYLRDPQATTLINFEPYRNCLLKSWPNFGADLGHIETQLCGLCSITVE